MLSLTAALALLSVGCSDEDTTPRGATKQTTLHLRTSSQDYGFTPLLRAVTAGYTAYAGEEGDDILMYFTQGNEVYQAAQFRWSEAGEWNSRVALEVGQTYYVYGYMPSNSATATIN